MKEIYLGVDGGGTKTSYFLEKNGEKFEVIGKTLHADGAPAGYDAAAVSWFVSVLLASK